MDSQEESFKTTAGRTAELSVTGQKEKEDNEDKDEYKLQLPSSYSTQSQNGNDGSDDEEEYNEEELKRLAASLAPRVSALLDSNEVALENLLLSEERAWREEEEKFQYKFASFQNRKNYLTSFEEEDDNMSVEEESDGMRAEWNRLSAAEQALREELEMSNLGFSFIVDQFGDPAHDNSQDHHLLESEESVTFGMEHTSAGINPSTSSADVNRLDAPTTSITIKDTNSTNATHNLAKSISSTVPNKSLVDVEDDDHDSEHNSSNASYNSHKSSNQDETDIERPKTRHKQMPKQSLPQPSFDSNRRQQEQKIYTLYDHARTLQLRFDFCDSGYPTTPLLTRDDVVSALAVPTFHPTIFHPNSSTTTHNFLDSNKESSSSIQSDANSIGSTLTGNVQMTADPSHSHPKTQEQKESIINQVLQCTREYVKPMSHSVLSKNFVGLVETKFISGGGGNTTTNVKRTSAKKRLRRRLVNEIADDSASFRSHQSSVSCGGNSNISKGDYGDDGEDEDDGSGKSPRKKDSVKKKKKKKELLPVRTAMIRIRPDVLCGAVMDAVSATVQTLGGEIIKRQGGHLRAVLPGAWVPKHTRRGGDDRDRGVDSDIINGVTSGIASLFSPSSERKREKSKVILLPPFLIDAQLCLRKRSRDNERILLVRVFRLEDGEIVDDGAAVVPPIPPYERADVVGTSMTMAGSPSRSSSNASLDNLNELDSSFSSNSPFSSSIENGMLVREAAALVQRIELVAASGVTFAIGDDNNYDTNDATMPVLTMTSADDGLLCMPMMSPVPSSSQSLRAKDASSSKKSSSSVVQQIGSMLKSPIRMFSSSSSDSKARTTHNSLPFSPPSSFKTPIKKSSSRNIRGEGLTPIIIGQESARKSASAKLMRHHKPTPSVKSDGHPSQLDPIPALCKEDLPFIQSSWRFLKDCLNELDNRDLAYSTLVSCPFGAFPALPTLDVQYCSQIKALCRENMIISLLKAARELEQFARESEFSCASLIQLLRPTFASYQLDAPPLPQPIPLSAYPLDFHPPEATCPPWGQKVMEALNRVAANSSSANSGFIASQSPPSSPGGKGTSIKSTVKDKSNAKEKTELDRARDAVSIVVNAFQRQDDEELSARLVRKNMQVMDRLAKMQAHKRESIISIRDSYGSNELSTKAADHFHTYAQKAKPHSDSNGEHLALPFFAPSDQVPLLDCRIVMGSSTGTCYISAHQMLLVTQLIPILGGSHCLLLPLIEIDIEVLPPSASMLNPLPAGISVRCSGAERKELCSFIPLLGAQRFKDFFDIVKTVATENPEALKFSARGGLLYMFDEKASVARAALGSDLS